ncbi:MAG: hypothetical protein FWD42_07535, partial [Solirubrobacterales bacterium]|nr:hypothetical protein [Solirubrobacterales bacterium]
MSVPAHSHTFEPPGEREPQFDISAPSGNLRRRLLVSRLAEASHTGSALLAVAVLGIVVYSVASRGASVLSPEFLVKSPPAIEGTPGGGIAPEIIGTALMMAMATVIAAPLGILTALFLSEFATTRLARVIKLTLDLLN